MEELSAGGAETGAITDANILCAAAMSVSGFSNSIIQDFANVDAQYALRRLFLANRIMDGGANQERIVQTTVQSLLKRDVDFIIQDLIDIKAVLADDDSWRDFWNWLRYVRDVNDGQGHEVDSAKMLPYRYLRVANPLNVVPSPALGFTLSDLLNAILGISQQPRTSKELEAALSLLHLDPADRLTRARDGIGNLSELPDEANARVLLTLRADALPLFSATARVLARHEDGQQGAWRRSRPNKAYGTTWLPLLDHRGYQKIGEDLAQSIPSSSGKLRPHGRSTTTPLPSFPSWALKGNSVVSGFHLPGARVRDDKHGIGTVGSYTRLDPLNFHNTAFTVSVNFDEDKGTTRTYYDPLSSCLSMSCDQWASLIKANPVILLYALRNGNNHPKEAGLGFRTLSRIYLEEKSTPSEKLQRCTKKDAVQHEKKHGPIEFDPRALRICASAFLFLAARDAPAVIARMRKSEQVRIASGSDLA